MKNIDYNINNIALKLWNARLGLYYNQNLQKKKKKIFLKKKKKKKKRKIKKHKKVIY